MTGREVYLFESEPDGSSLRVEDLNEAEGSPGRGAYHFHARKLLDFFKAPHRPGGMHHMVRTGAGQGKGFEFEFLICYSEIVREKGFAPILVLVVVALGLIFVGGVVYFQLNHKPTPSPTPTPTPTAQQKSTVSSELNKYLKTNSGVSVALISFGIDEKYEKQKEEYKKKLEAEATISGRTADTSEIDKNKKLGIRVGFTSEVEGTATYNPARFRLKDGSNNQYNTQFKDPLRIYSVKQGETTEYDLSYLIPKDEKSFRLIYENVEINISLKDSN